MPESVFIQNASADPDTGAFTRHEGTPPYDITELVGGTEVRVVTPTNAEHLVTPIATPGLPGSLFPGQGEDGGVMVLNETANYVTYQEITGTPPATPAGVGDVVGSVYDSVVDKYWRTDLVTDRPTLMDLGGGDLSLKYDYGNGDHDLAMTPDRPDFYLILCAKIPDPSLTSWTSLLSHGLQTAAPTTDPYFRLSQNNNTANIEVRRGADRTAVTDVGTDTWGIWEILVTPTSAAFCLNGGTDAETTFASKGNLMGDQLRIGANSNSHSGCDLEVRGMLAIDQIPTNRAEIRSWLSGACNFTMP